MAPPTQTPAAAPAKPADVAVNDCKTALLYSDKAPLAADAAAKGKWDFEAVWAHVPKPPTRDKLSVLIYLHGNKNWVTVKDDGGCKKPDWAESKDNWADPAKFLCAPHRYELASIATADKQPIVLVPEDASPIDHIITAFGNLRKLPTPPKGPSDADPVEPAALGDFVEDCFKLLHKLNTKGPSCSGTPYLNLAPEPKRDEIKRLFLSGHSGGGRPLAATALSDLALKVATDLCLLDCTYGWGDTEYVEFCKKKKASLGNAAGESRLLCFFLPAIRDKQIFVDARKKQIEKDNAKIIKENEEGAKRTPPSPPKPLIVKTDAELETEWEKQWKGSTKQHVEDNIIPGLKSAGFKFDSTPTTPRGDALHFASGDLTKIEAAMSAYPVVFVEVSGVAHDKFPNKFIPMVLRTANV